MVVFRASEDLIGILLRLRQFYLVLSVFLLLARVDFLVLYASCFLLHVSAFRAPSSVSAFDVLGKLIAVHFSLLSSTNVMAETFGLPSGCFTKLATLLQHCEKNLYLE